MKHEGKIGDYGTYSAELVGAKAKVLVGVEIDVIAELRKLAKKTDNQLDDTVVDKVEALLNAGPAEA